jgi:hypothetical protein
MKARAALASFITDASDAINESYWFSIRGECESSLCVHTMLEMDEYCELLYVAELVNFGKRGPQMSKDVWLQFLKDEQLLIEGDVQHSITEVEEGQVDFNKLKALKGEPKKPKDLLFLRIGKYNKDGERVQPTTQFNFGIPPPMFNGRLTTAHRRFRREIADIVGHIGEEICTEKF